jgi:hypothetical protein
MTKFRFRFCFNSMWMAKLNRRNLLIGGAAAGASMPLLHQLVPHQGLHDAIEGAKAAEHGAGHGRAAALHGGGAAGPSIRDRAGQALHPLSIAGLFVGAGILYLTSLLVSV